MSWWLNSSGACCLMAARDISSQPHCCGAGKHETFVVSFHLRRLADGASTTPPSRAPVALSSFMKENLIDSIQIPFNCNSITSSFFFLAAAAAFLLSTAVGMPLSLAVEAFGPLLVLGTGEGDLEGWCAPLVEGRGMKAGC